MPNKKVQKDDYLKRLNRVIDYIDENLQEDLNLATVSAIANFSPFHFHRIFSAITGETLNNYINRIRIEKAARLLISEEGISISELSDRCGFNSDSVFCRCFKSRFGVTTREFLEMHDDFSKNDQWDSKINKLMNDPDRYFRSDKNLKKWRSIMKDNFKIKELPELKLAYCRHTGAFDKIGEAFEKLFRWAGPKGLLEHQDLHTVTVYHDDPKITQIEKLRQSACITLQEEIKPEGEFGFMKLPGGRHVVGHFEIDVMGFEDAWNAICLWMAEKGYQASENNPYEFYYADPKDHPEGKFVLDICIPVK